MEFWEENMSYTYNLSDLDNIILGSTNSISKNKICLNTQCHVINNDISLVRLDLQTRDNVRINVKDLQQEFYIISFMFGGNIKFTDKTMNKTFYYKKNQTTISSPSVLSGYSEYVKNENILGLDINLSKNFIEENAPFLLDSKDGHKHITTNPKGRFLAYEIYNSPFCGNLEKLYLQSKVLEFIYLTFSNLNHNDSNPKVTFSNYDMQALKEAKIILETSFENPPTIKELSKKVHLNEFKLKYGMKRFFHSTPYQISLIARLKKAKILLQSGDFNVNEVSQQVGYKRVQNFSKVFTKFFGLNPKELKRQKSFHF